MTQQNFCTLSARGAMDQASSFCIHRQLCMRGPAKGREAGPRKMFERWDGV